MNSSPCSEFSTRLANVALATSITSYDINNILYFTGHVLDSHRIFFLWNYMNLLLLYVWRVLHWLIYIYFKLWSYSGSNNIECIRGMLYFSICSGLVYRPHIIFALLFKMPANLKSPTMIIDNDVIDYDVIFVNHSMFLLGVRLLRRLRLCSRYDL